MKLILASKNAHKAAEMQAILGESIELITQSAAGCGELEVIEDGDTFEENAVKKAVTIMKATGISSIADDSGLCVDALEGRPGLYTARFAGENATDDQNIEKLLKELQGVAEKDRTARFVCVIALAIPGQAPKTFRGEVEGRILFEKHGDGGFGYDPVFYIPQLEASMAEIPAATKNSVSHRFNALKLLKEYISRL